MLERLLLALEGFKKPRKVFNNQARSDLWKYYPEMADKAEHDFRDTGTRQRIIVFDYEYVLETKCFFNFGWWKLKRTEIECLYHFNMREGKFMFVDID